MQKCWNTAHSFLINIIPTVSIKPSRNDPCHCGSGKKHKHCCERKEQSQPAAPPSQLNEPAEFTQLIALYNAKRYAEMETRARTLVEHYPKTGFGWKLLGGALLMQGKEALPAFEQTVALLPGDAEAHYNLGVALKELGRLDEAVASYQRAVKIKPDYAEAHSNLGNVLKELRLFDQAVTSHRRALAINPNSAAAHNNLGIVLYQLSLFDEAVASYRNALMINPDYAEAHSNLGNALIELGQLDRAVLSFRRALEVKPDYAEAHYNLGNAQQSLKHFDEARASYHLALKIKPDYSEAHSNLGNALKDVGQWAEAVASYRRALELKPYFPEARSSVLFTLNYMVAGSSAAYLAEALLYGQMAAGQVGSRFTTWRCEVTPPRLRVGMVSGDFNSHPVGYFLESVLAHIDPARIELIAYATQLKEDALTARIKPPWPMSFINRVGALRRCAGTGLVPPCCTRARTAFHAV